MKTRLATTCLLALAAGLPLSPAVAQIAPTSPPAARAEEEVVKLNVFEVATESDRGLLSTNAVSATKNNTPIKDIPANIYVLNESFIKDQIPFDLNDILRFAPGINLDGDYRNETYQIRGFSGGLPLADGFTISRSFPTEQSAVERVEVLQGPAGILFGNVAGVGGIVNRIMKKPSFKSASSLGVSYRNDANNVRLVYDSTGPLRQSKKLAYRLIAAFQHTDGIMDRVKTDRQFIRPTLLWKISDQTKLTIEPDITWQRTVVGYRYDYFNRSANGALIRVPDGINPAEDYQHTNNKKYSVMTTFIHQFSPDWTFRAATFATANFLYDDDPRVATALNGDNRTINRGAADAANGYPAGYLQQQDRYVGNYYLQADLSGKFNLGSAVFRPVAGLEWKLDPNQISIRRTVGGLGGVANAPFDMFAPRYKEFAYQAPIVTYDQQQNYTDARGLYFNNQVNLFSDRLKLVTGVRFIKSATANRTRRRQEAENRAATTAGRTPLNTRTTGETDWDHTKRIGAVYDVTKALGAFAGYSESYEARTNTNNLGEAYPPGIGEQKEAGLKTGFFDGRITSTVSYYELKQTNNILSYATGTTGPRGETSDAIGSVQAKGWDVSGVVTVTESLQFLPGYSRTKATTLVGGSLNATGSTTSNLEITRYPANVAKLYGKYTFKGGAFKGLSLNGGGVYTNSVNQGVLAGIAPAPTTNRSNSIIPSSMVWNIGANYWRKGWGYGVKVDNLANLRYYIPSASSTTRALIGLPRVVSFDVTRKF
ncbi:MAG: TonB-dependent receptor [Undibacterium sp.]|nr:TonB-dependent receptor [Opitutaceae bacterium]